VTDAPATTAPLGSVTVPTSDPVVETCAKAAVLKATSASSSAASLLE
jgi:hypothetical protein